MARPRLSPAQRRVLLETYFSRTGECVLYRAEVRTGHKLEDYGYGKVNSRYYDTRKFTINEAGRARAEEEVGGKG